MSDWSLTTATVDGSLVAAILRPDGTLATAPELQGYAGLVALLEDWETLAPVLEALDVAGLPTLENATAVASVHYPRKLIGSGPNYTDHMAEMGADSLPEGSAAFFYFVPPSTTIIGDGETILIPEDPKAGMDWEAELAVVIGRRGRDIPEDEALSYVAGYACFNDVTARGYMRNNPPIAEPFTWDWSKAKGLDTFCPIGAVKPAWFVSDPQDLSVKTLVNGVVKQDSSTKLMVRGVAAMISEASAFWTLEPGDVLATGTAAGVGHARGEHLTDGDVVRVEIADFEPLSNPVRFRTHTK